MAHGYDAGVRLGEVIEEDIVAVAVSGNGAAAGRLRAGVSGESFGAPSHPRELVAHRCIGWRRAPKVAPYRWGINRGRRGVQRRGRARDHDERYGVDDKARHRRGRHQLRHGRELPSLDGARRTGSPAGEVIFPFAGFSVLLREPPRRRPQAACARGSCAALQMTPWTSSQPTGPHSAGRCTVRPRPRRPPT